MARKAIVLMDRGLFSIIRERMKPAHVKQIRVAEVALVTVAAAVAEVAVAF